MSITPEEMAKQLRLLLPPGLLACWSDGAVGRLLLGASDASAIDVLINEAHAGSADELLREWEAELGLPPPCITTTQTLGERRAAILAVLNFISGNSVAYYTQVAASMGIEVSVVFDRAFEVGRDGMGDAIGGDSWRLVWHVTASAGLTAAARQLLESTLRKIAPARTFTTFTYS
jgi:uncharacterized protein YmfQ (DUF2313 family)